MVIVIDGVASPEMIEAELNHLYRRQLDWAVTPTSGTEFSVVFPDVVSHSYATRSDQITLALNKLVVDISEPILDPKAVAVLDTAWILIASLPDIARSERVIRQMSRILGKVVVVDELSLRKEEEVRVKVKCLDSDKLRATIQVFFNDQGFDLRIAPEPPNHVGRPRFTDDVPPGGRSDPHDDYHGRHHPRSHRSDDEDGSEDSPSHSPPPAPPPSTSTQGGRPAGRSLCASA